MMTAVLVLVLLTLLVVASVWPVMREWKRETALSGKPGGPPPERPAAAEGPESLEGVLVRQLVGHEISGAQYRHAMRRLAERDDERHPLPDLPDDTASAS